MEENRVLVRVDELSVSVGKGFEKLARHVLETNIGILDIYEEEDVIHVVFGDGDDLGQFMTIFVSEAPPGLLQNIFGKDTEDCIYGTFTANLHYDCGDRHSGFLFFLEFPRQHLDGLLDAFETASKRAASGIGDLVSVHAPGMVPMTVDDVPKTSWDGSFVGPVPGIEMVAIGCEVKAVFHATDPVRVTERMWILVTGVAGDEIVGVLNTNPVSMTNLSLGDQVSLRMRDVVEVRPSGAPAHLLLN